MSNKNRNTDSDLTRTEISPRSNVQYISIPVNRNVTNDSRRNDSELLLNDSTSVFSSSSSINSAANPSQDRNDIENNGNLSKQRRKSILDYPIGSFKGVNSIGRFASSLNRAHSFKTIDMHHNVERSFFKDSNDQLYDPVTLAPSKLGRRLSSTLNKVNLRNVANNSNLNGISARPNVTNVDDTFNHSDINNSVDYGSISRQTSQHSLLRHSISIANSIRTTNNLNELENDTTTNNDAMIVRQVQDKDGKVIHVLAGQSTAPQTIFNSINVLIGLGLLALPLGLRHAGWIFGLTLLTVFATGTFCSAELLSRCLDTDPTLMSYADLGYAAFGSKGRLLISCLFTTDLLGCGVSLIILFGDSLNALFPRYSVTFFKIIGFFIVTPPVFLPLSILSNISLLGILATIGTLVTLIICGILKHDQPGSLVDPMPTNLWPENFQNLCLSIGLLSACWGGHAVFPNLKTDMRHPEKFKDCLKTTYKITFITDFGTAIIGFLMFGDLVLGEITTNIMLQNGYPNSVYLLLSALMAIIPIAKTPLNARPIISILDFAFGVQNVESDYKGRRLYFAKLQKFGNRIFINVLFVIIAILFPKFDKLIAFLGAGLCFTICLILPCLFYLRICKNTIRPWERIACKITIVVSIIFGSFGIGAAIMS
ncbi:hypothetical protein TPHA_0N00770 [Tetrapisispora phaffii CBS 4417]|uniref:Amino acid transporter transmembrane domain-containing protein n=1 Tax=Tetrapisispora phaffii (strain ATCC 24235 / CBS 4417 / NBRC 1672 / NRRL Y-8282 / UCD 70-5) TaxID=1071381 RepID=G8C130_TETPH|nr:hypothetical protein TPHA_0N00770 [Tetrapisispora phaffii CBS 4417]CCE65858.1 hypothetical protein TPHA_0N00770 [Tetrapisispora phaffii CBS 4417]